MNRADAHIHLFATGYPGRYGRSPAGADELAAYQDLRAAHGIGRALVVGYEAEPRFAGNNAHLAALAADHDWIAPVAYVPPSGVADLAHLRDFAGLSAYLADLDAAQAFEGWVRRHAATLNATGAIVSLNATPVATAGLARTVAALDGCTILFSHLGLPGPHAVPPTHAEAAQTLAPLLALAGGPHVGVKISGLYAVSDPSYAYPHTAALPFILTLLERFGPDRLYWGSDFSPSLDHVSFPQTLHPIGLAGLAPDEAEAVYGGNLLRALERRYGG
ncbi:amidohydrolase family protein [Rhizohabitans arisaemae]|uniref:amidohydrolase family protein n=1 Tax=Rhizohabitans arisaemae TaxID=2720610 RepID=UPI0024B057E3|nr:amidohydrolase family protein [Rhizohabitans arisaemae]